MGSWSVVTLRLVGGGVLFAGWKSGAEEGVVVVRVQVYYPIHGGSRDQYLQQCVSPLKDVEGLHHQFLFNLYHKSVQGPSDCVGLASSKAKVGRPRPQHPTHLPVDAPTDPGFASAYLDRQHERHGRPGSSRYGQVDLALHPVGHRQGSRVRRRLQQAARMGRSGEGQGHHRHQPERGRREASGGVVGQRRG
jgi:hypothetical protein